MWGVCPIRVTRPQRGNIIADNGAADALLHPESCTYNMAHLDDQYMSSLPAWPSLPRPSLTIAGNMSPTPSVARPSVPWFASNLTSTIKSHILTSCPALASGPPLPSPTSGGETFLRVSEQQASSLSHYNNAMWTSSSCSWGLIHTILKVRTNTILTASKAHIIKKSYPIATGPWLHNTCPLCAATHPYSTPPIDSLGHWLGDCSHPLISPAYTARHNRALCSIQATVSKCSPTPWFTIMDATPSDSLPFGVHSTRLPAWLFATHTPFPHSLVPPDGIEHLRPLLRPDMLILHGLSLSDWARYSSRLDCPHPDLDLLTELRNTCTIHIVELTFSSDASFNFRLEDKKAQHHLLIRLLLHCGWHIHSTPSPQPRRYSLPANSSSPIVYVPALPTAPTRTSPVAFAPPHRSQRPTCSSTTSLSHHVHIFILTHSCTIPTNLKTFLDLMHVPPAATHRLLTALSIQIVRSTHGLIRLRRRLENDPHTFVRPLNTPPLSHRSTPPHPAVSPALHPFHDPP